MRTDRCGIDDDFQKILIARARLKVMMFETRTPEQTKQIVSGLIEQIKACSQSIGGDLYLFAAWEAGENFIFTNYPPKS